MAHWAGLLGEELGPRAARPSRLMPYEEVMKPAPTRNSPSIRRPRLLALSAALATAVLILSGTTPALGADRTTDAAAAAVASKTVTVTARDTATVSSRTPKSRLASKPLSATASQDRSYLLFSLPADVDRTKPIRASLSLTVRTSTANAAGVEVFAEPGSWSSSTLTHANRPAETGSRLNERAPVARAGQAVTVSIGDVTPAVVRDAVSLRFSYEQRYISSTYTRSGQGAPKITLTYTPKVTAPPTTPTPPPVVPNPPVVPAPPTVPVPPPAPSPPTVPAQDGRAVFAHYFPPYPRSIDNRPPDDDYYARNYLQVQGENGRHAAYGGLLRDRPEPVPSSTSTTWRIDNLRSEIRQAKDAGIDGFTVNIMSLSGTNWDATRNLMTAAEREGGFTIVPMIDASASAGSSPAGTVADRLAELYRSPAAYKVGDKRLLSSFAAEKQSVGWWSAIVERLRTTHRIPITFQAVFLAANDANMNAFRNIADGYGNWGVRTEWHTTNGPDYAAKAAALGKTWMAPVSVQDYRPRSAVYAESGNTANLRASWQRAIAVGADYVQLVTWNDYSESTQFAPSVDHGETFLDVSRPYLDWFRSGREQPVTSDQAFLTHRTQAAGAAPSVKHRLAVPTLGGITSVPTDNVEALVYLTAPATVTVTVGGVSTRFEAPAGRTAYTVPLRPGTASVTISRSGRSVVSLTSPHRIVDRPTVQDLSYYGATSLG